MEKEEDMRLKLWADAACGVILLVLFILVVYCRGKVSAYLLMISERRYWLSDGTDGRRYESCD